MAVCVSFISLTFYHFSQPEFILVTENPAYTFHSAEHIGIGLNRTANHGNLCFRIAAVSLFNSRFAFFLSNRSN